MSNLEVAPPIVERGGLDEVAGSPGMQVTPHPHTGLQTVSWLLEGTVHHRDSLGNDVTIEPGQLGLMTAGRGIAHSEQSPVPHPDLLHGAQLWVALPEDARQRQPTFEHHVWLPTAALPGAEVTVVLGDFDGLRSPGQTYSPLIGLDVTVRAATTLPLESDFEYAAVALSGRPELDGSTLPVGSLLYLGAGRRTLSLGGSGRLMLLGGEPFAERIVMWWNLVARDHDEIAEYRAAWNERGPRFTDVPGWHRERLVAPPLPGGRLRAR